MDKVCFAAITVAAAWPGEPDMRMAQNKSIGNKPMLPDSARWRNLVKVVQTIMETIYRLAWRPPGAILEWL
jgi:hypothetical protein